MIKNKDRLILCAKNISQYTTSLITVGDDQLFKKVFKLFFILEKINFFY